MQGGSIQLGVFIVDPRELCLNSNAISLSQGVRLHRVEIGDSLPELAGEPAIVIARLGLECHFTAFIGSVQSLMLRWKLPSSVRNQVLAGKQDCCLRL